MTVIEMMTAVLRLIGVAATGETLSASESADGLQTLQIMLDSWSNQGLMVYARVTETLTLTGATSYTIGTGGTFNTVRPTEILGACVTSGGLDYPMNLVTANVYRDLSQKTLSGTSNWLYYSPAYPLGKIYIAPVGSGTLTLESLKPLTEPSGNSDSLSFPPGYEEAIKYNWAVRLAPEYGRQPDQVVMELALSSLLHIKNKVAADRVELAKLEILELSRRWSIDGG